MTNPMRIVRTIGIAIALLSVIPLGVGAYWHEKNQKFIRKALKQEATVVEVIERRSDGGVMYHPVFSFIDSRDREHRIHSSWGACPSSYEIGDKVQIYYDPESPEEIKRDSFVSLWLGPICVASLAVIPLAIGGLLVFVGPILFRAATQEPKDMPPTPEINSQAMTEQDAEKERMWAMLCHMTALSAFAGIPFGNILGPLVLWLMRKNVFPMVDTHGKESLNFQISMTLYSFVSFLLCFVLVGFLLLPALFITNLILVIIASLRADKGELYRYPFTLRLIR